VKAVYDLCMRTRERITVSVPSTVLDVARRDVEAGAAASISAWLSDAAEDKAQRESLTTVLSDLLEEAGGPLSDEERAWAISVLKG